MFSTAVCYTCPEDTIANSKREITQKFGWRTMANGLVRPQARCKRCRVRHQKIRRRLGLEKKQSPSK